MKIPYYLTVDFEDFHHDYQRLCGLKKYEFRQDSLNYSYEVINNYLKKNFKNKNITFFITGVVAKAFPHLVRKIKDDGHEVCSHYFFHDNIRDTDEENFSNFLDQSIEALYKASGSMPLGFRAPNFAIEKHNTWAYKIIKKNFLYDSSCRIFLENKNDIQYYKSFFNKIGLFQFYISQKKIPFLNYPLRSGGTFMKVFPIKLVINLLRETYNNQFTPIIYLHPYEILSKDKFWVKFSDFKALGKKKYYYWVKQSQWTCGGGDVYLDKINLISEFFEHQGLLKENVDFKNFNAKN